jgi:signal transduction histidine kinase
VDLADRLQDAVETFGPRLVDVGLVAAVGLVGLLDLVAAGNSAYLVPAFGALAVAMAATWFRRRAPHAAFAAVLAVILADAALLDAVRYSATSPGFPRFAPVATACALVVPIVRRSSVPFVVGAVLAGALAIVLGANPAVTETIFFLGALGGMFAVGVGGGLYLRGLDRQRLVAAERARNDERLDLARELHDLVAHHVTAIVVQAQAAQVVADRDPAAAGEALGRIEEVGKESLAAMRRLVGSLRAIDEADAASGGGGGDSGVTAPIATLDALEHLVEENRRLGLPVRLTVDPTAADAPATVAASAHRIVQESLTNARRHAEDPRTVDVDLRRIGGDLVVTVTDDGRWSPGEPSGRRGYGLVGMRERAQLLDGDLTAGPVDPPGHGWRVRAVLPVGDRRSR